MLRFCAVKQERLSALPLSILVACATSTGCVSTAPTMRGAADYSVILSVPAISNSSHAGDIDATSTERPARAAVSEDLASMGFTEVRQKQEQGSDGTLVRAGSSAAGENPARVGDGRIAVILADWIGSSAGALRRELALFQLHRAMADGATGGLLLDCGTRRTAAECLEEADPAALHRVLDRATAWGGAIAGTKPAPLQMGLTVPHGMKAVCLVSSTRELLFVRNSSMTRFARGVVSVPAAERGGASRAIEIPSSPSAPAGRVIRARDGRIEIELALRPADAVLFRLR